MTIRLTLIKQTDLARLYRFADKEEIWIPRSVIKSMTKFPSKDPLNPEVHELNIEDWWWDKQEI